MVVLRGTYDEDVYLAGGAVDSRALIRGDLAAAGGQLSVAGQISGDVLAGAGQVDLVGSVGDDVRALGGQVRFAGEVGGDAVAAGGTVGIDADARVGGRALLAGGMVTVAGRVGKGLRAAGKTVILSGEVGGDALLAAGSIEVLATARIDGELTCVCSEPPRIAPGARIVGPVTHRRPAPAGRAGGLVLSILLFLGTFLVGWMLHAILPRFSIAASRDIGAEPVKCLGVGVALLVGGPIAVAFLLLSVVGAPLGVLAGTAYLGSLVLGYLIAAMSLADLGLRRLWKRPQASSGARLLALLAALAALALGVGALALRAGRARLAAARGTGS